MADVGWVPGTGAGTRRAELLPAAAAAAGRDEERLCADAVEGQARRLEQRLGRSGVHAGAGVARRRRGTWRRYHPADGDAHPRSEEHTSELQSLMRISYAVFCLKKKNKKTT